MKFGDERLPARFWAKVRQDPSGCWLWTTGAHRYGQMVVGSRTDGSRRQVKPQRLLWTALYGDPGELHVLHRCDVPRCLRPDHLFLGTHQDNMTDLVAKGRNARGERHASAKVTVADVVAIRRGYSAGQTFTEIGRRYGISDEAARCIVRGKSWRHVAE